MNYWGKILLIILCLSVFNGEVRAEENLSDKKTDPAIESAEEKPQDLFDSLKNKQQQLEKLTSPTSEDKQLDYVENLLEENSIKKGVYEKMNEKLNQDIENFQADLNDNLTLKSELEKVQDKSLAQEKSIKDLEAKIQALNIVIEKKNQIIQDNERIIHDLSTLETRYQLLLQESVKMQKQ
ncbi:MAG TPA: hypothetical protein PLQ36_03175, partial [Candidatus Gracilibacteria bacterium]|nr:hypothetical protein [Candidatus Gracilibacteria bacterium]